MKYKYSANQAAEGFEGTAAKMAGQIDHLFQGLSGNGSNDKEQ